ncbi:MAG TPA: HAD family hydrolase [Candidatus Limnocylindrales bacterium]|nr:HAD family hydrolase [Candidatus Limnocylindrales bacterium]
MRLRVRGITFDFGNTLIRVDRAGLGSVVTTTVDRLRSRGSIADSEAFLRAWVVERDRQFRLQVPRLREVDLSERFAHVFARLRGAPVPADDEEPWAEAEVAARSTADEVAWAVGVYSAAFVAAMSPVPDAEPTLREAAARGFRLGVLSNWPHAPTIDRYLEARGWTAYLSVVVVSQRVGVIKPHPAMFAAAADGLGLPPGAMVHVGDDWAADVVGARGAGWHSAYLRGHQGDTPLPTSERDGSVEPDIEIDRLAELLPRLELGRP